MSSRQSETSRRSFLKAGAAGVAAFALADLASGRAEAAPIVAEAGGTARSSPA